MCGQILCWLKPESHYTSQCKVRSRVPAQTLPFLAPRPKLPGLFQRTVEEKLNSKEMGEIIKINRYGLNRKHACKEKISEIKTGYLKTPIKWINFQLDPIQEKNKGTSWCPVVETMLPCRECRELRS